MGTLFSTLDVARSGLQVAQLQLDVVGHNIANVNKEGFSRQRVELVTREPIDFEFGQIGRGVGVSGVVRLRDEFLDDLYRRQTPGLGSSEIQAGFLSLVEGLFLEPSENGVGTRINLFFDALSEFSTNVESLPSRQSVVAEAETLVGLFNDIASRLFSIRTNANEDVRAASTEINSLAERIANVNSRIRVSEIGGNPANDLRDERGVLLDELSTIVDIFTRERTDGQLDVLIGGDVLVDGGTARLTEAVANPALDPERNDLVEIRFVDTGQLLRARSGELFGAQQIRDATVPDVDSRLDQIAAAIIEQINLIQSRGNGIADYAGSLTSSNPVTDPTLALNAAGLPFTVSAGSFDVNVYDGTGAPIGGSPFTVNINGASSLNDVASALNGIPNLTASVTVDGNLQVDGAAGFTYSFANDDTGVLGAVGLNTLFTGFDGRTIGVNQVIANDPRLLASAFSTDPLNTGDNEAALAMAAVQEGLLFLGGTATIEDFYESTIVQIGVEARANLANVEVERSFVEEFDRRRQAISGVSIDEEATLLIQYQRAFEASARVVTVTDRMLETLLTMAL